MEDGASWRAFCDRLAAVGDRILADDFPSSPSERAAGVHHLANQVVTWLAWSIGYPHASHPAFFRQNDLVSRWGGPNVDQVTRRARVDPSLRYRLEGNLGACEDFILTVKDGDMHEGKTGILAEVTARQLGLGPGDDIVLDLGGDGPVPLPSGATMVNLREYYFDWRPAPPALVTIRCLDTEGEPPPPLTLEVVDDMLDRAASLIEHSVTYWNRWVADLRAELGVNQLSEPRNTKAEGGSGFIAYGFGFPSLEPGEVLLVESEVPDAEAFDVQLYSLAWFESLDFANRTTSLNHTQTRVDADGRMRFVVSVDDPGVPNWLDTGGRSDVMLTYRWIKTTTFPVAAGRVVPLSSLRDELPADTPVVDTEWRRQQRAARQAHAAWRYRT